MNRKLIVTIWWTLLIALIAWIIVHLYRRNVTLAQWHEIVDKHNYIKQLRTRSEQFSWLIADIKADCEEKVTYYEWQKTYVDATIEKEENEIANTLGLTLQR